MEIPNNGKNKGQSLTNWKVCRIGNREKCGEEVTGFALGGNMALDTAVNWGKWNLTGMGVQTVDVRLNVGW